MPQEPRIGTTYCSFCGKGDEEVAQMFAGPSVFICSECLDQCQEMRREHSEGHDGKRPGPPLLERLLDACDAVVPGQGVAKRAIAGALIDQCLLVAQGRAVPPPVLVCGPIGSGKRLALRAMCETAGLPTLVIDVPMLFSDVPFGPAIDESAFGTRGLVVIFQHLEALMDPLCGPSARRLQHGLAAAIDGAELRLGAGKQRRQARDMLFIAVCDVECAVGPDLAAARQTLAGLAPALLARFGTLAVFKPPTRADFESLLNRPGGMLASLLSHPQDADGSGGISPDALGHLITKVMQRGQGLLGLHVELAELRRDLPGTRMHDRDVPKKSDPACIASVLGRDEAKGE